MMLGTKTYNYKKFRDSLKNAINYAEIFKLGIARGYIFEGDRNNPERFDITKKWYILSIKKSIAEALQFIKNPRIIIDKIKAEDFCNAVKIGNLELIEAFIEKGIDVNMRDKKGNSPIFYAQNKETIDYLIRNEAEINILNKNNYDALTYMRITKLDRSVIQHFKKYMDFSNEEKIAFYKMIKELLTKELAIAKSQGKNLLVMIGEAHYVFKIYKAEKIILQVARELGIQSLYVEQNDRVVNESLKPDTVNEKFQYVVRQIIKANKKHMHIEGVDVYHDLGLEYLKQGFDNAAIEPRNSGISKKVLSRKKDAVLIVGADHLKGLLADKELTLSEKMGAKKQFHIVPIALTRLVFPKSLLSKRDYDSFIQQTEMSEAGRFGWGRKNVIHVDQSLTFCSSEALSVVERWNVGNSFLDIKEQAEVEYQLPLVETERENKEEAEKIYLAQQEREQEAKLKREQDLVREKREREAKAKREQKARLKREREAKEKREREYKEKLERGARKKRDKEVKAEREREENAARILLELRQQFQQRRAAREAQLARDLAAEYVPRDVGRKRNRG